MKKTLLSLSTVVTASLFGSPLFAQAAASGGTPAEEPPFMPELISSYGDQIDDLFWLILVITTVVAVVVLGLMIYSLVVFRHSEGRRAQFTHGSNKLEVAWTLATAGILIFIAVIQKDTWDHIKQELPAENEAFLVRVFAERFGWSFVYPGPDGTFETNKDEDIFPGDNDLGLADPEKDVVRQTLYVPRDRPVILELVSKGKYDPNTQTGEVPVLHAFFSPHLRLKQDIVPYMPIKVWFRVLPKTDANSYEIVCAELCGEGHYLMNARMEILGDAELKTTLGYDWLATGAFPARFREPEPAAAGASGAGSAKHGD